MNNDILLSICIPTYKRAIILDGALNSINKAVQLIDKTKIEIVISDNCIPSSIPKRFLIFIFLLKIKKISELEEISTTFYNIERGCCKIKSSILK